MKKQITNLETFLNLEIQILTNEEQKQILGGTSTEYAILIGLLDDHYLPKPICKPIGM